MRKQKDVIIVYPKLYNANGDLSKQWFVYYYYKNPYSGKLERIKIYDGINRIESVEIRTEYGKRIIKNLKARLQNGYNPFDKKDCFFDDEQSKVSLKFQDSRNKAILWQNVFHEFLEANKNVFRISTYQTYKSKVNCFLKYLEEKKLIDSDINYFSKSDANDFKKFLLNQKLLSNKMVNQYFILLKRISDELIAIDKLKENPFKHIKALPQVTNPPKAYNDLWLVKMKETISEKDPQLWLICKFIFYCFIRPIELRYTKLEDIDFANSTITIRSEISKNKKTQTVIIPQVLLDDLIAMGYNKLPVHYYLITLDCVPGEKHVGKNYMFTHFQKIRKMLGLPSDYKFYGFKHTGGLKLKQSGADPFEMRNQFRHYSLDQMMQYLKGLENEYSNHIRFKGFKL